MQVIPCNQANAGRGAGFDRYLRIAVRTHLSFRIH